MERIYLDNAATTSLDPAVLEAMMPYLTKHFGNPSSIYSYGRESRMAIENSRKSVAKILNAHPAEIFFTSGGTESSNMAITASVRDLGCKHIISSSIEHHATSHTIEYLYQNGEAALSYVKLLPNGHIDLTDLESLLANSEEKCLVTLMHANNEIGNMLDIHAVGDLCKKYNAIFHSDTVQTVGHFPFNLRNTPVHFITGAGHKFHGPKGVGMLYINENVKIKPYVHGGSQERNMRAGTENLYGIVGFAKALELATTNYENDSNYITELKHYMMNQLNKNIKGITFNGDPTGKSLYAVLSVSFPKTEKSEMILFNLDINNICASGGSACTSGADQGSHVIRAINNNPNQVTVRFSFSKHNTKSEIDAVVEKLKELI
ncbi:MAG: cysteine desulfurase [Sphingobacteriia bacterium 24-36-13]|jgi:cysteine desulfurase|uniref:cysteine desulfurase family protein n=1 Tax=Sediminibacterium sp. TaxID=1917865 RepID=UPI000BD88702|nr:cysteine desulfurase family protein [Sediminibacterium sp.]OYY11673.1 MAG: cysteine desulfurase [Sphingobacteriia bacterium 35-36-14]OYZ53792.1 MAG: cysteine desulfurase [Sphingobacteriia bacterium 24-36-13]OZA65765.1 MAG: cysteine desulfurase [Sphingobacteriia bacterium 39-36-14]HQS24525.1 cysteine desulfurase family protein [Sediminibacterium sp.]HQS34349.1 cysteine desulfurase family protein [Sediminibacterium sp.]